ncbi:hypothetical protein F511_25652 [Dorcoceras hygrometricum]|uniref:Uncharacterized protein n=1 Tax=Dorcoceras hygrometricum TaxID=472368 RepID=A0A2Z7BWP1_9LAMI|nr:hypothetical protein F511_25652 [Dorcoceras hygrometricum]
MNLAKLDAYERDGFIVDDVEEEEMQRQESMIVNNFGVYDDVKAEMTWVAYDICEKFDVLELVLITRNVSATLHDRCLTLTRLPTQLGSSSGEALSVIPCGSWGDVARRLTMIRWLYFSPPPPFPSTPSSSPPVVVSAADPPPSSEVVLTISARRFPPRERDPDPPLCQHDELEVQNSHAQSQQRLQEHLMKELKDYKACKALNDKGHKIAPPNPPPLLPNFGRHLHAPPCVAAPPPCPAAVMIGLVPIIFLRRIRLWQNPSDLLVQSDGGIAFPVVDLIRRSTAAYRLKCRFPRETGRSQAPRRQQGNDSMNTHSGRGAAAHGGAPSPAHMRARLLRITGGWLAAASRDGRRWQAAHAQSVARWFGRDARQRRARDAALGAAACGHAPHAMLVDDHYRQPCAICCAMGWATGRCWMRQTLGATCAMIRACRGSARPCAARNMLAAAAVVRRTSRQRCDG